MPRLPSHRLVTALRLLEDTTTAPTFEAYDPDTKKFLLGRPHAAQGAERTLAPTEVPAYLAGAADALTALLETLPDGDSEAIRAHIREALAVYRAAEQASRPQSR